MLKSTASSINSSVTGWVTAENYSSLNLKTGDCMEFYRYLLSLGNVHK